mgnify:CR=1 FL=1
MFKKLVQMGVQKLIQSTPRSQKVGPTITSVKPNLTKTVADTKSDEYKKRINLLNKAEKKLKTGKEMMKTAQKERKNLVDTGRAFQFKHSKSYHVVKPGDKDKILDLNAPNVPDPKVNSSSKPRSKCMCLP